MCEGRNRVDEKLKIGEIDLLSKEACECYATPQVATSSSGVEQRAKQLARAVPYDLHSYANQQEGSELHNDIRSRLTQKERQTICKRVANVNCCRYGRGADAAARIENRLAPRLRGSFAPRVIATEIEPGPTVKGRVSG